MTYTALLFRFHCLYVCHCMRSGMSSLFLQILLTVRKHRFWRLRSHAVKTEKGGSLPLPQKIELKNCNLKNKTEYSRAKLGPPLHMPFFSSYVPKFKSIKIKSKNRNQFAGFEKNTYIHVTIFRKRFWVYNQLCNYAFWERLFVHYIDLTRSSVVLFYILVPCISMRKDRYQNKLTLFTLSVTINEKDVIMNNFVSS